MGEMKKRAEVLRRLRESGDSKAADEIEALMEINDSLGATLILKDSIIDSLHSHLFKASSLAGALMAAVEEIERTCKGAEATWKQWEKDS
jgi:hypothetical protein